ncbi:type II and III secretion system protein [Leptothrix cholodnii SP-6]|uniref:Type II and III secretion system protein n=1 Tax=Leptothrix cholodnii (strain ATCC 51168 / LMG 8142 / SP-6) TaxID=395495 RepID=B1Y6L5_LEPCP|nr:secretin N-terminal domain-containing protein [Leptothrix cholodnii]ACB36043.1 type II and III secretion system protein [Leptothrix cholodnii SP-6]
MSLPTRPWPCRIHRHRPRLTVLAAALMLAGGACAQATSATEHAGAASDTAPDERPAAPARLDGALLERRITLQLRDVPLGLALDSLAGSTGLRLIRDRDVRTDARSTLFLTDARVGEALEVLLLSQQLAMRALDGRTALIYPNTPAKQRTYGELQVRTFVLRHTEAATMATLLKSLVKSQSIVTDPRSNTLVLRDTPEVLQLAEQLIAINDRPSGDVVIEVQLIEVNRQRLSRLGLSWPTSLSIATPASATTLGALRALGGDAWLASPLALGLNLQLQDIGATVIANPSVRARHKEKARLLIGDKVPVMTTQLASMGGSGASAAAPATTAPVTAAEGQAGQAEQAGQAGDGGTVMFSGSVQYIDVGFKLEVEPQVHADGDVDLDIDIELSQITQTLDTDSGVAYQLGVRQAQTSMRLRDGETQWLGGLIRRQERAAMSGLPGLSQLPVIGRLFGLESQDTADTELVLAVTPRIARPVPPLPAGGALVDAGLDAQAGARPIRMQAPSAGEAAAGPLVPIVITGNNRAAGGAGSRAGAGGAGGMGSLPDPATIEPMRSDMPGLPAVMPRPMPNRNLRQSAPAAADVPAEAPDDAAAPR